MLLFNYCCYPGSDNYFFLSRTKDKTSILSKGKIVFIEMSSAPRFVIDFMFIFLVIAKLESNEMRNIKPLYLSCFLYLPNLGDFLEWLHRVTYQHAEANCYTDLPSCDDTNHIDYKIAFVRSRCVAYQNRQPYFGDDYVLRLVFCPDNLYKCVYKVCYDFSVSPPRKRTIFLYSEGEPPLCPSAEPQLPPPGKTWDEPWVTDCFEWKPPACPIFE